MLFASEENIKLNDWKLSSSRLHTEWAYLYKKARSLLKVSTIRYDT